MDCDPGVDDAIALMLVCRSPELSLAGVIAAPGNAPPSVTAANAAAILRLCGRSDVPVYMGASRYLTGQNASLSGFCGENGLCGIALPDGAPVRPDGVDWLCAALCAAKEPLTLLSTAPLTDLALALKRRPEAARGIAAVVTVCGYYGLCGAESGMQPRAEWNAAVDLPACEIISGAGIPVCAIGLDVSGQLTDSFAQLLLSRAKESCFTSFVRQSAEYYTAHALERFSLFVDAMAAAWLIQPELAHLCEGAVLQDGRGPLLDTGLFLRDDKGIQRSCFRAADRFDWEAYAGLLLRRIL